MMTPMATSMVQPVAFLFINAVLRKGQEGGFLPLLALLLMIEVLGKEDKRAGRGIERM